MAEWKQKYNIFKVTGAAKKHYIIKLNGEMGFSIAIRNIWLKSSTLSWFKKNTQKTKNIGHFSVMSQLWQWHLYKTHSQYQSQW